MMFDFVPLQLQLISKGVTEAFAKLHDRAVLVVRASG